MRRLILMGALPLFAAVAATFAACPPAGQCHNQNDCPLGQNCASDSTCVDAPPPPPPHGEGEGEGGAGGEGEGEGGGADLAHSKGPIGMFVVDPFNATRAVVTEFGGGFDQIRGFDLVTGVFDTNPTHDFNSQTQPCGVDTIDLLTTDVVGLAALPPNNPGETWFGCANKSVKIMYGTDFASLDVSNGINSGQLVRVLGPYPNDSGNADARALVTSRGGAQLQVVVFDGSADSKFSPRGTEAISGVTFSKIGAIFVLSVDDVQFGDIIVVFDLGSSPPKLIPLQRELDSSTWHGAPIINAANELAPLSLPVDTAAVILREKIGAAAGVPNLDTLNTTSAQDDTTNLIVFEPTVASGKVEFFRYEDELRSNHIAYQPLDLQTGDSNLIVKPAANDRILLQEVNNGGETFFYYALPSSNHAWRVPIPVDRNDNRDIDVRRAFFDRTEAPNGMVPIPGDDGHAWFSFGGTVEELARVPFVAAF